MQYFVVARQAMMGLHGWEEKNKGG